MPSQVSPKISSISLPLPIDASTPTPNFLAVSRKAASSISEISIPVKWAMASAMVKRFQGRLKSIMLPSTSTCVVPCRAKATASTISSTKFIIHS